MRFPRIVVAAAASGQGKTTVAVGLMAALSASGLDVSPGKVGPDYIDPGYHALATGRPGRNLDPWLLGPDMIVGLFKHAWNAPRPADIGVIEGVMGLFDGRLGTDGFASTAHVAKLTSSPVVLVLDASSTSRTIAATALGMRAFDPGLVIAGVILNKVGSTRHADEARRAIEGAGVPVLGCLPRDERISAPSRHLGLVPVAERPQAAAGLDALAGYVAGHVDLEAIRDIAATASDLTGQAWTPQRDERRERPVVAVAGGRAFTFRYPETDELLISLGCDVVTFDPASDTELPPGTRGIYLGGGFPEVHADTLASNRGLLADIADAVASGAPTVAECAGLLYLCRTLDGRRLVGSVPAAATMHPRLRLGFREAMLATDSVLGSAGTRVRGHEFHRTRTDPVAGERAAWAIDGTPDGFALDPARTGRATVHASYLHTHWAGFPELGASFAAAVQGWRPPSGRPLGVTLPARVPLDASPPAAPDPLLHHGDAEAAPGLANFSVNVRLDQPPAWLADIIAGSTARLGAYPDPAAARAALASYHDVAPECVLPTAGAAEAFTLVAQGIGGSAVVVHPQFTEPEAALRRAGRAVTRHMLAAPGFALDAGLVPSADVVVVGNPTNPTGVLHPVGVLRRLDAGVLVVDEAFMDAVPGEVESLLHGDLTGVLVLRSLTKTWGLAGLRAGYVVGDPVLVARLAAQQTPWSVSTPALEAMVALATLRASREQDEMARVSTEWRRHLVAGVRRLGLAVTDSSAPFVLVKVGAGVHGALRDRGVAARRCDTFPGLDGTWIRLAVREPHLADSLLNTLRTVIEEIHDQPAQC